MTWVEEGTEQGYEVTAPSGATFQVISPEEVRFFEDIAARYQSDNHFCVPGDAVVAGPGGPRKAIDVSEGDVVWSIEASTKQVADSLSVHPRRLVRGIVTKKAVVPAAPVFEIRTQNRTLRCSGTHPVLTWVVRPPLGKRGRRGGRLPNRYQYEWVPASDLRLMDRIVVQKGSPDEPVDLVGTRLMDESFVEFCGLFTGDGLVNNGRELELPDDCGFASVTMIKECPPEILYDIQVDEYKSFVVDGVVVHNSNVTDLMDLDRLLVKEVMCWRWGRWLSQEHDYEGQPVDLDALAKAQDGFSKEIRLLKKAMGLEKAARDREKGESISDYLENLRRRAKEFGVKREDELIKCLTLFQELKALLTFHDNCDGDERRENDIETEDLLEWVRKVAIPEYDLIDLHFRQNSQKYWIRDL